MVKKSCRCAINEENLLPMDQPPSVGMSNKTRYLFLLGFPFSGTSALHFLLATSQSVSTISDPRLLSPGKEGWLNAGLMFQLTLAQRWEPNRPVPWDRLYKSYHQHWNLNKPILLENSPPEMYHALELNKTFSVSGKVRFVLLVRSACSKGELSREYARLCAHSFPPGSGALKPCSAGNIYELQLKWASFIADTFGSDVFILRYEDLCLNWAATLSKLAAWEPRLHDIDITRMPKHVKRKDLTSAEHRQTSIKEYCETKISEWEKGVVVEDVGLSCTKGMLMLSKG